MAGLIKFWLPENPRFLVSSGVSWISEILSNEKGNEFWFEVNTADGMIHEGRHVGSWDLAMAERDDFLKTLEQLLEPAVTTATTTAKTVKRIK